MSLFQCQGCRKEFDSSLDECPKCSRPSPNVTDIYRRITMPYVLLTFAFILAIYLYFVYSNKFENFFPQEGVNTLRGEWGALGDFFGGILNPVFAFLGLIMLVLTLRINTKELALATKEMKKSAEALEEQSKSLNRQNFESTFFKILDLYNTNVLSLKSRMSGTGRDCFVDLMNRISSNLSSNSDLKKLYSTNELDLIALEEKIKSLTQKESQIIKYLTLTMDPAEEAELSRVRDCLKILRKRELEHYMAIRDVEDQEVVAKIVQISINELQIQSLNLYLSTVELLFNYVFKNNNSVNYYDLIRSQMSVEEVYFLFYATISIEKTENLKMLCCEAALFKDLDPKDFAYGKNHWRHHEKKAFGVNVKGVNFNRIKEEDPYDFI